MRLSGQNSPSEFLPDVVNARVGADFDFIGIVGMYAASNLLPSRNYKSMIAARPDTDRVFGACHIGAKRRTAIGVGSVNVDNGMCRRWRDFLKWAALHRASERSGAEARVNQDCRKVTSHLLAGAVASFPEVAAISANRPSSL